MSNSGSSGSFTDSTGLSMLGDTLQIPNYHFKAAPIPSIAHGENVDIVFGYRISNKKPVIAKVSTNSLRLEREYYVMKRLYQSNEGSSFLVKPLEYVHLQSGLTIVIYADEGQNYLDIRKRQLEELKWSSASSVSEKNSEVNGSYFDDHLPQRKANFHPLRQTSPSNTLLLSTIASSSFQGPIYDLGTFLRFAIKCTDCLEFIHRNHVTHGEIRLSAFQWNGEDTARVKLWNFGNGTKTLETYLTSEGWRRTANNKESMDMLQNLLVYMSPEQTGRTTYVPDHRSDIYSLGIAFYVLVTGRNPFQGSPLEILQGILSKKVPLANETQLDVPEMVARIIEKMTHKSPDDRYCSAFGIRADLKECLRRLSFAGDSLSLDAIEPFNLAEKDVASVFTLPKHIYGRQSTIVELSYIIQRIAGAYKSTRIKRERSKNNSLIADQNSPIEYATNDFTSEGMSSSDGTQGNGYNGKSYVSPSYSSGFEGSDSSSSTGKVSGTKVGAEIVAISGPGGVGKSTLFNALQNVARQYGYVAYTKFDSKHKVPYSSILKNLSQILQQILSESEDEIHAFYDHLKISLGTQYSNIKLLADLVPELRPLMDPSEVGKDKDDQIHIDNVEARVRFHNLFVEVFRGLSQWCLITVFLDDLHFADEPSIELVESLVLARCNLLFFVAFRDQQPEPTEAVKRLVGLEQVTVHKFNIETLDFNALVEYIGDALHRPLDVSSRDSILPLADLVYKKTRGNAFYLAQLLLSLEKKKLIFFNWEENEWDYNLKDIQQVLMTSNSEGGEHDAELLDVNFLVSRLKELPLDGQRLLKWASFVGDTFSWNTVKYLMLHSDPESDYSDTDTNASDTVSHAEETECITSRLQKLSVSFNGEDKSSDYASSTSSNTDNIKDSSIQSSGRLSSNARSIGDPISGLQAAIQEGYILPLQCDEFKWSHDRYSQAAMELVNPKTREKIHLKIAKCLFLQEENPDVLLIADHLLKCLDLVLVSESIDCFRDILYEAGNKARTSGAHKMAFNYYKASILLLDKNPWETDYSRTLLLYSNAVSLSWNVGEYETTESYLDIIFNKTKDPVDRVTAYRIQAKYYFARQWHAEGEQAICNCIRELEVEDFDFDSSLEDIRKDYIMVLEKLKDEDILEKIVEIGECKDRKMMAILNVIEELCTITYFAANQRRMLHSAIKLTYYSLTYGLTEVSGIGIIFLGIGVVSIFKDYNVGEKLGALGLKITELLGNTSEKGHAVFLYTNFLSMWKYSYRDAIEPFVQAEQYNLASGDRIYASFAQLHRVSCMFISGVNLDDTLAEARNAYEDIHAWSASADMNVFLMSIIRTIKALQGQTYSSSPETIFDGDDGFNDRHFISENMKHNSNPEVILNFYEAYRVLTFLVYGYYEYAISVSYMNIQHNDLHPCHRHTRLLITSQSLAILQKINIEKDTMTQEEIDIYLERVESNQDILRPWMIGSDINFGMWYTLVEAEKASISPRGNLGNVLKLYEEAINKSRRGGWFIELCLSHEYLGDFYIRQGLRNCAYTTIKKAISLYMKYGCYGKANHLAEKHNELLHDCDDGRVESHSTGIQTDQIPFVNQQGSWSTSSMEHVPTSYELFASEIIPPVNTEQTLLTLDILDMASILKSSQVLSSEVKFDGLLKSMISIILENSGADCGAIIVKDERFGVCAYGSQMNGSMTFDPPRALSDEDDLVSSRIIHHTINTGDSIFVHNVEHDARFSVGPWYDRVGHKSVICMPIVHKSVIAGCLFLEGAAGIFTQRHITVLGLLCQQMGISITNAFLFKSVQNVTMANMRMIEMQKKALEEAKRSKEAAVRATRLREIFLANMSHEIRTPFSGFYGMISLLAETDLDPEQKDLVKTAKESCEILLQIIDDLLNFSKLQAGKVTLDLSPIVVEDLIADVVEMLIPMAIKKSINIAYIVSNDVPYIVMLDGNRLRQILINLLGNAIKFTHEGEIYIQCSVNKSNKVSQESDNQVNLLFEVIDTGIGISKEQKKVLFEPFSQVDGSTTRKYGGTGLGLSICLQLVKLMSGSINVSSSPGKGSNFYFNVCVSKIGPKSRKLLQTELYPDEREKLIRCISTIKVACISKYNSTTDMIHSMLPGIHVKGVSRVEELQELITSSTYDVIVVGLYTDSDNKDTFKSSVWLEEASKINKDGLIIIMNYPINGKSGLIEHISNQKLSCKAIRMAVPLRRIKLLRTIGDVLNKDMPSPASSVIRSNNVKLITDEEREIFSKMNILIAEDNPVAQKLLLKQLTRLGFQVECANNGLEAINEWVNRPDGYFVMGFFDHHMPKCDGVVATKRIREIEKVEKRMTRFPIVALTADVQDSARHICINAGMDGYMTKPLNQKILAQSLRTFCLPNTASYSEVRSSSPTSLTIDDLDMSALTIRDSSISNSALNPSLE